jgi:hypothetical protein
MAGVAHHPLTPPFFLFPFFSMLLWPVSRTIHRFLYNIGSSDQSAGGWPAFVRFLFKLFPFDHGT